MPLEPGELLNHRYRIERILGRGGMGAVYLATDESLSIHCAVKENLNLSPESERLFRREATLLASLRHPNLPRVTNHFVLGDEQYLVMDFVEGEDLKERLARGGPLPEADVLRWAVQICNALTYLHERTPSIIHRDIKPANIKLTASGEAMLVDFGIAKITAPDQQTLTNVMGLTPGFAPPEQYGTGGRTDARTDEYALAATLYNLLTGQVPPDSMERLLGNSRLIPPSEVRPGVSAAVSLALVRALEIKPDERFSSVAEFKSALLGQAPVQPATVPAEAARPTLQQAAALASAVTRVGATAEAAQASEPATAPAPARLPKLAIPIGIGGVLLVGAIALGAAFLPGLTAPRATETARPTQNQVAVAAPTNTARPTSAPTDTSPPPTLTASPEPSSTPAPPTGSPTLEPTPTFAGTPIGGGGRIAFISDRDGQLFQVYTMNPDGSDAQQLTFDPTDKWSPDWTFGGTQLAWSPDGKQLLYVAPGGSGNDLDLWLINADGANQVNLTSAPGDDYQPTWCGDGTIWFTSTRVNDAQQLFYTTLADVQQSIRPRNFSATHGSPTEYDVALFPDCQRLIFITTSFDGQELRRYFLDGTSNRTFRSGREYNAIVEDPAISPDGQYVLYTNRDLATKAKEIFLTTVDDRLSRIQLTDTLNNVSPQWSPDGQWVVFVSTRDQNREIYLMPASSLPQKNLTDNAATDTDPVWQPVATP